ncbi:fimbrillin family protein [uncultured Parabacteroides sp.]|uniref:fimbrillin family protein n=1 Tax=uncultured Parabacteroides sp. TaxID=512312 RepID=UPI00258B95B0|nr:fimbrillin family protein [uncultured Parabacteroides sp.]
MKTLVLSMISIAATLAAMTACTSEGDPIDEGTKDTPVEIKLNAGVMEITSKAAIEKGKGFTAKVIASATTKDYSSPLWTKTNAGNITVADGGNVTFSPEQYYPADGSTIYMIGIAPQPENAISNGTVNYTITGDEDIMFAEEISGKKKEDTPTSKELQFKHLLTQLKIQVIAENQDAIDAWGTITSIQVLDAATELNLDLGGTIAEASDPKKKALDLNGFSTEMDIPSDNAKDAGYCMLLPLNNSVYKILVKTSKNDTGVTIPPANLTKLDASTAYTIKLTFKSTNVVVTATAGEWVPNTEGSGTVE